MDLKNIDLEKEVHNNNTYVSKVKCENQEQILNE